MLHNCGNRAYKADYKRFCKQNQVYFVERGNKDDSVKRIMPRRKASSYVQLVDGR